MGLFSKKKTTTQHQTQSNTGQSTVTNNVPDFIRQPTEALAGQIGENIAQGPGAYTPQISANQQKAYDTAGNLGAGSSGYFQQARDALGGAGDISVGDITAAEAQAAGLLDNGLEQYYNPFKDQITNPVLTDYDVQSGQTRAAQAAAAARNKSFQGSRYGIQEAATEGELARGRAATEGGLLSDMFKYSTSLAGQDADRRQGVSLANAAGKNAASAANQSAQLRASEANQQAALQRAQQLAALGLSEGGESRANLGVLAGLGASETDANNAIRQYPLEYQRQQEALLQGLNPELYTGKTIDAVGSSVSDSKTKEKSSDPLGSIGQMAQIAALFAPTPKPSDRRLKRNLQTVGYDAKGRRWVTFAYIWAPLKRVLGVIAQEVMRTDPEAVVIGPDGYLMVDYARVR